jgi:hypothetical protein
MELNIGKSRRSRAPIGKMIWARIKTWFEPSEKEMERNIRAIGHPGVLRDYQVARDGRM